MQHEESGGSGPIGPLALRKITPLEADAASDRLRWAGLEAARYRARLRAVVEYVEEHLDANPTLEEMAALARLSPNYFASQFRRATGLPPHQYVILRRVERAKQVLQTGGDFSLAEVAAHAGFSDQSQFSHHFKRLVGVTPGRFRAPARTA